MVSVIDISEVNRNAASTLLIERKPIAKEMETML
jgi:hypothetical protein